MRQMAHRARRIGGTGRPLKNADHGAYGFTGHHEVGGCDGEPDASGGVKGCEEPPLRLERAIAISAREAPVA